MLIRIVVDVDACNRSMLVWVAFFSSAFMALLDFHVFCFISFFGYFTPSPCAHFQPVAFTKNRFCPLFLIKSFSTAFICTSKMVFVHTVHSFFPSNFTGKHLAWTQPQCHKFHTILHSTPNDITEKANMVDLTTLLFRNWNGYTTWLYVFQANFLP